MLENYFSSCFRYFLKTRINKIAKIKENSLLKSEGYALPSNLGHVFCICIDSLEKLFFVVNLIIYEN